jgi:hypothetical protein
MEKNKANENADPQIIELLERLKQTVKENVRLYFITRIVRDDIPPHIKRLNKHAFRAYQVDIDDKIRKHLYDSSIKDVDTVVKKNYSLIDYDPISDDMESLFSYKIGKDISSFSDDIINQLGKELPKVESLERLMSDSESLWAYCVEFYDVNDDTRIYTFRKIMNSKVAIDENDDAGKSRVVRFIRTLFNVNSKELTLMEGESIILDKQIDCVYYNDVFYIIRKQAFEQIVGLQEEYHKKAVEVAEEIKETGMVDGLENVQEELKINSALHKKLVKLKRIGGLENFDAKKINKMVKTCKKYGETLKIGENGHICISTKQDFELLIKALCDYYKIGEVSGKGYGTFSGRELKVDAKK